jgi:hypothetical protein
MTKHCWHSEGYAVTNMAGTCSDEICCRCGLRVYATYVLAKPAGHGRWAPEVRVLESRETRVERHPIEGDEVCRA